MRESVNKSLFNVARGSMAGLFIGKAFEKWTRFMPVRRIIETDRTIVFKHPLPGWEQHLLAVPKGKFPNFASIDFYNEEHREHLRDLLQTIQNTAVKSNFDSYAVRMNGGNFQDVPQIHFHVIPQTEKNEKTITHWQNLSQEGTTITPSNANIFPNDSSPELLGSLQSINLDDPDTAFTVNSMFQKAQGMWNIDPEVDRYSITTFHQPSELNSPFRIHLITGKPPLQ